ncbi:hypothetical protein J2T15_000483 [Paenibacillus harenae]|uniref:Uncharacterized protein n=1 Tax=Paenibacillus harenae TaxID=306543 RepID=A0ABT9TUN0_PAEHA|nr:hypothetical protein [Paenibacillus harenae]
MNSGDLTECDRRGELVERMLEQDINIKKKARQKVASAWRCKNYR